mmetsp:Transcript_4041/g.6265  ORF Transcript_4041/g.6265 Transcript_4041/m.6265 type:complete len:564 (+) Transcript_4041:52-1743(+)
MGTSASLLSPELKAQISKDVQEKYKQLTVENSNLTPAEIMKELALVYDADINANGAAAPSTETSGDATTQEKANDATTQEKANEMTAQEKTRHRVSQLIASESLGESPRENYPIQQSLRYAVDTDHSLVHLDRVSEETAKIVDEPALPPVEPGSPVQTRIGRSSSSAELLQKTNNLLESQARISSFINQLKGGDITTQKSSGFRVRRLTYAQKTAEEPERPLPLTSKRTTIYASKEIGVTQEKKPPFPPMVLGTFSCHGIEPAPVNPMEEEEEDEPEDEDDSGDEYKGIVQKTNQDRGCVVYPYNNSTREALFMCLDGHGEQGDRVSEFAMRNIVHQIEKNLKEDPENVEEALTTSFIHANTALMTTPIKYMTSGSTCVTIYIRGNSYWVANCGDSRAVVARKGADDSLTAVDLSRDHKPDDPIEAARITSWGGFVSPAPEPGLSARVWLDEKFTMIGLAMARSIGDYAVKSVGVIPTPEVTKYEFLPEDEFIIMASDGVWEFISSQEAVEIVRDNLKMGAHFACQELIQTAAVRWQEEEGDYRDDITAVIFTLPLPMTGDTE